MTVGIPPCLPALSRQCAPRAGGPECPDSEPPIPGRANADRHPAWRTGAETLRGFLRGRRRELHEAGGVTIVAHSHGGQVLAYALAEMHADVCPVHVVTVDMPVRRDMDVIYGRAAARCHQWVHLYSERGWKSRFRWLGNRFGSRTLDVAHRNRKVSGGHSGILDDAGHMDQWDEILSNLTPGIEAGTAE